MRTSIVGWLVEFIITEMSNGMNQNERMDE